MTPKLYTSAMNAAPGPVASPLSTWLKTRVGHFLVRRQLGVSRKWPVLGQRRVGWAERVQTPHKPLSPQHLLETGNMFDLHVLCLNLNHDHTSDYKIFLS